MSSPQPNPQVLAFAWECTNHLQPADAEIMRRAFTPPDEPEGQPTPEQLEMVYGAASRLCDEENYRFAAGLALHLATHKPDDPRFTFIAGTCLQRLAIHNEAAKFFCFTLIAGGDNAAALYRLGECLYAIGDTSHAEKALDAAYEVARDAEGGAPLQDMARGLIERARAQVRPSLRKPQSGGLEP